MDLDLVAGNVKITAHDNRDDFLNVRVESLWHYADIASQLLENDNMREGIINALKMASYPLDELEKDSKLKILLKELSWEIFSKENYNAEFCLERAKEKMAQVNERIRELD